MAGGRSSPPVFVNIIWFVYGFIILAGNAISMIFMWRTKKRRERVELGLKMHATWNVIGIHFAFASVGFTLTASSLTCLATDDGLSKTACDVFGFSHAFFYHFSSFGVLFIQADKLYCFLKAFSYHVYTRSGSNIPLLTFSFCIMYGIIIAVLPLLNLGTYSWTTTYSLCLLTWYGQTATRVSGLLNIGLVFVTFLLMLVYLWQTIKVLKNRCRLNVSLLRRKNTEILYLIFSSLFLACWIPYSITMLVATYSVGYSKVGETWDKVKASLFAVTLIPLLSNPFLNYFMNGHFRDECDRTWIQFKSLFPAKKTGNHKGEADDNGSGTHSVEETQM